MQGPTDLAIQYVVFSIGHARLLCIPNEATSRHTQRDAEPIDADA